MKPSGISDHEWDEAGSVVRTQSEVVPAPSPANLSTPEPRTAASRVVPVGPSTIARGQVQPAPGIRRDAIADDDVTVVDGAFEPLKREQREALARRIRSELENTRPIGAAPRAQAARAPSEKTPAHQFKQTMLLGIARAPSSSPPSSPAAPLPATETPVAEPASLRGSFVRVVGPPTSPPPRRSRRTGPPTPSEPASEAVARAPESEPEHEAFALDRRSSVNLTAGTSSFEPRSAASSGAVLLPPPPGPADYEISESPAFPPAVTWPVAEQSSALPRTMTPLEQLPSVDPFAGFVARRPSVFERWLIVLVVALALVGAAALAAIALGYLGRAG